MENMDQENTQTMEIMDINSADDDDITDIVTVKEEYSEVLISLLFNVLIK